MVGIVPEQFSEFFVTGCLRQNIDLGYSNVYGDLSFKGWRMFGVIHNIMVIQFIIYSTLFVFS
jgi:hypothetical protein